MFVCVDCHLIELQKYNLFVRNVRSGFIFCTFGWRVNELTRKFPLRVVLKILFLESCYSEMWFVRYRKCLFESLFGHIARYAPSQTFKNTLPIAHKSLFQNY